MVLNHFTGPVAIVVVPFRAEHYRQGGGFRETKFAGGFRAIPGLDPEIETTSESASENLQMTTIRNMAHSRKTGKRGSAGQGYPRFALRGPVSGLRRPLRRFDRMAVGRGDRRRLAPDIQTVGAGGFVLMEGRATRMRLRPEALDGIAAP